MKDFRLIHQKYLVNTYPFRGKSFERGRGAYLYDAEGEKYLDLMTGYGVNIFGHSHPKIVETITDQAKNLTNLHASFANEVRAKAAHALVKRCGRVLSKVYFSNSGSEAVEAALKFAISATGKTKIIAMENSFHGKSLGALSVTYFEKYKKSVGNLPDNVTFVSYGSVGELEKEINKDTAAVIIEPVQGDGGIITPPDGYLMKVREACNKNKALLIFDEVQSGIGRTGNFLASQKEEVTPDILCLGKALAGGIPAGATLVTKEISEKIPKLIQTSTFGGNPLACASILTVLELLNDEALDGVRQKGEYFLKKLNAIKSKNIKEVRGRGLMIGVEVKKGRNNILKALQERKILACPATDNVVRFLPPYIITKKEIDRATSVLEKILKS